MNFTEISPFVRYIRYFSLNTSSCYPPLIPCDARMFYVHEGEGAISVGKREYAMKKGCVLFINSGIEYHLKTPGVFVKYIAVNFDYTCSHANISVPVPPRRKDEYTGSELIEHVIFDDAPEFNGVVYLENMFKIEENLILAEKEFSKKFLYSDMQVYGSFICAVARCASKVKKETGKTTKSQEITAFVRDHYNENITNELLGEKFGFHPNYISMLIKRATGKPLHKYVLHLRMLHALEMLDSGSMNISEVAVKTGFCNVYYFSSYFKKEMGISPSKYR